MSPGPRPETAPDGTFLLDQPVVLPEVLDILVSGGGPFGTAVAFRAKELGLSALVIDYDDLMKRIRDYAKDKQILPDFGGGDSMQFPKGGPLVRSLEFEPIDKDEMCERWKGLYRRHRVPAQIGVELLGLEREGELWRVLAWNHNTKADHSFRARHVVLAVGRGVPRRLDVTGNVDGLAFGLSDPTAYVGEPACVVGGGTSAAEAVIAISNAKQAASDGSPVFWSYRGDKMPKVSKALAEVFFEAFVGNGNVRYLPNSEPVAVVDADGDAWLSIRTARVAAAGMPIQTTQFEFRKRCCIACIGEDIPAALLAKVGVHQVTGGASNKRRMVVTPLLETRQPDVYLAGDVLSPLYLEAADFEADPAGFVEIKRRGNIKAALRDGVMVAEVIAQKLAGRVVVDVHLEFAGAQPPAPAPSPAPPSSRQAPEAPSTGRVVPLAPCRLVAVLPTGVEANEYPLKPGGATTIGRLGTDIAFADDAALSDMHAVVVADAYGYMVGDKGSAQGVFVQPAGDRGVEIASGTIVRAGRQWLVVADQHGATTLTHYDAAGRRLGGYALKEGANIIGRESPDITIAREDQSLSRRHLAIVIRQGRLELKDLGSANGTQIKIRALFRLADGDRLLLGHQVLRFDDQRVKAQPASDVTFDTSYYNRQRSRIVASAAAPAVAPAAAVGPAMPEVPAAIGPAAPATLPRTTEPGVLFANLGRRVACEKGQTICEAAEAAGIRLDADCHQGACGMDPVRVVSGAEHLNAPGSTERNTLEDLCSLQPGPYRLACMARVNGPVTVETVKQR
ncbi:MAG: FHA domain-containing protein [Acidobacteria bacterium]|nr:FHA domain-containing protein [Acidobacteriota bacterium]